MFGLDTDMIYRIPALLVALTIHEYAHAQAADSLGDSTPRVYGRLTLNPLAHLDPIGLLLLLFAGFGWARPVAINPSNFRNIKSGIKIVAFAGPGSNFFVAFMAILFTAVLGKVGVLSVGVFTFLMWLKVYNVWFALFNLIPIPPLDGSKLLASYLSPKQLYQYQKIQPYSMYILLALVFTGVVGMIISPFAQVILGLMSGLVGLVF